MSTTIFKQISVGWGMKGPLYKEGAALKPRRLLLPIIYGASAWRILQTNSCQLEKVTQDRNSAIYHEQGTHSTEKDRTSAVDFIGYLRGVHKLSHTPWPHANQTSDRTEDHTTHRAPYLGFIYAILVRDYFLEVSL